MTRVVVVVVVALLAGLASAAKLTALEKATFSAMFTEYANRHTEALGYGAWTRNKGLEGVAGCDKDKIEPMVGASMAAYNLGIALVHNQASTPGGNLVKEVTRRACRRFYDMVRVMWKHSGGDVYDAAKGPKFDRTPTDTWHSFLAKRLGIAVWWGVGGVKTNIDEWEAQATPNANKIGCEDFRNCWLPIEPVVDNLQVTRSAYGMSLERIFTAPNWDHLNARQVNHLYGRTAEPGEKLNPYAINIQRAGLRYILARVMGSFQLSEADQMKTMFVCDDACKAQSVCKGACLDELKAIGLAYDRLEFQRGLRAADVREGKTATHDKGFFAPVPGHQLMVKARAANFRIKRDPSKVFNVDAWVGRVGLPPYTPEEMARGSNIIKQGGEAQQLNPTGQPETKAWLDVMHGNLLSAAAGPSGTTDEVLTLYDLVGVTGHDTSGARVDDDPDKLACFCARAFAISTMLTYFHHTLPEIMEGANNFIRCPGVFDYDHLRPYDTPVKDYFGNNFAANGASILDFPTQSTPKASGMTNTAYDANTFKAQVQEKFLSVIQKVGIWTQNNLPAGFNIKTSPMPALDTLGAEYYPLTMHTQGTTGHPYTLPTADFKFGYNAAVELSNDPARIAQRDACICNSRKFEDQPNFKHEVMRCPRAAAAASAAPSPPPPSPKKRQFRSSRHVLKHVIGILQGNE